MKFLFILVIAFVYVALAQQQQQESSSDASTPAPPALEEQPRKPFRKSPVVLFPQVLPGFNRLFVADQPDADVEFEQVQGPLEYQFNDRFSVEPFFTFPPNAGGGLNFRYRF